MYIGILLDNPKHHITLSFLSKSEDDIYDQYKGAVAALAQTAANWYADSIKLQFGSLDIFEGSGAWHTKVSSPDLMNFQQWLTTFLDLRSVNNSKEFAYVPHVTLTYFKKPKVNPYEGLTLFANTISVISNDFGITHIKI